MRKLKESDIVFEPKDVRPTSNEIASVRVFIRLKGSKGDVNDNYWYQIIEDFGNHKWNVSRKKVMVLREFFPKESIFTKNVKGLATVVMQHIIEEAKKEEVDCVIGTSDHKDAIIFLRNFEYEGKKFIEYLEKYFRYDLK